MDLGSGMESGSDDEKYDKVPTIFDLNQSEPQDKIKKVEIYTFLLLLSNQTQFEPELGSGQV
jgi:hypothetical protein